MGGRLRQCRLQRLLTPYCRGQWNRVRRSSSSNGEYRERRLKMSRMRSRRWIQSTGRPRRNREGLLRKAKRLRGDCRHACPQGLRTKKQNWNSWWDAMECEQCMTTGFQKPVNILMRLVRIRTTPALRVARCRSAACKRLDFHVPLAGYFLRKIYN